MLSRDSRNEKKLKAILRAEYRLKQRLDYIDWEEDDFLPKVNEFKAKAQLPELPEEAVLTIEWDEEPGDPGQTQQ